MLKSNIPFSFRSYKFCIHVHLLCTSASRDSCLMYFILVVDIEKPNERASFDRYWC